MLKDFYCKFGKNYEINKEESNKNIVISVVDTGCFIVLKDGEFQIRDKNDSLTSRDFR